MKKTKRRFPFNFSLFTLYSLRLLCFFVAETQLATAKPFDEDGSIKIERLCKTNPISEEPKMNLSGYKIKDCENKSPLWATGKQTQSKPIQSQYKPNSRKAQMVVSLVKTRNYNNEQRTMYYSKQTQSNPTCSELACPERGRRVEPISKEDNPSASRRGDSARAYTFCIVKPWHRMAIQTTPIVRTCLYFDTSPSWRNF